MSALAPQIEAVQRRLRSDTPFWAGGVNRGPAGEIVYPGAKDWKGAAKIVNKQQLLVPAVASPWQVDFDDKLEAQRAAGKPMRAIVLKARKLGFSTWVALKFLQRLTQFEYQHAIVCAQDTKTAGKVFDMARIAHANLPTYDELGLGFNIRPEIIGKSFSADGRKYMEFGEPSVKLRAEGRTGSSIFEIDTAKSPEAGRGSTPFQLHLSEVARWEATGTAQQALRKMLALIEAVPYELETIVVQESTANGLNHFYKAYMSAKEGSLDPESGESYFALFVPWHRDPGCSMLFDNEAARERFVGTIGDTQKYGEIAEDEEELIELYDLTPEQLAWRRMKIRALPDKSVSSFKQENPASDEEAFIGSGQSVFSGITVARAIKYTEALPRPVQGTLRPVDVVERQYRGGTLLVPQGAEWVPAERMQANEQVLELWEHPRAAPEPDDLLPPRQIPTAASSLDLLAIEAMTKAEEDQRLAAARETAGVYVIGGDIAEGEANTFGLGDFHAAAIFDHITHEQVAAWASRCDLHEVAYWLLLVALYFNEALLAVEVNGPGIAVASTLHKDYRYPRMYRRKRVDRLTEKVEKRPGWETNKVTKPAMESTFGAALAADEPPAAGLRDPRCARELKTYVIDNRGKHGALAGEHDDRLLAAMIARQVLETETPLLPSEPQKPREPSDHVTGY